MSQGAADLLGTPMSVTNIDKFLLGIGVCWSQFGQSPTGIIMTDDAYRLFC
jgi:hypothetical protein